MCTVPVETGPFYALKIGPTMFNTQGGPRRNQYAQVIGIDGLPIEGLFEGGEMGSVFADMYNGGGNLSETMVFGRFAGQNAAKRAKSEFEGATEPAMTHQEKLDAEAAAAAAESAVDVASVPDGTYEGSGQGYGGKITLSVTVEGGMDHLLRGRGVLRDRDHRRAGPADLLRGDRRDPGPRGRRHRLRRLQHPARLPGRRGGRAEPGQRVKQA